MGAKTLPAPGFPAPPSKRQPLIFDFRQRRQQSNNKGSLKTPYQNDTLNPFDSSQALFALPSEFWGTPVFKAQADGYMVKKNELYCPGFIGNTFSPNAWDYVEISYLETLGVSGKTPGVCTVSVRRGRKIDRKKSSGTDGETITFTGISNADIEIAITVWTPEQLDVLTKMWALLQPPSGKGKPGAWDIKHPQFGINQVKSAMFVDSIGLEAGATTKTKTFVIKAIEYLPAGPKKSTRTPDRSQARKSKLDEQENSQPGKNPKNVGPH